MARYQMSQCRLYGMLKEAVFAADRWPVEPSYDGAAALISALISGYPLPQIVLWRTLREDAGAITPLTTAAAVCDYNVINVALSGGGMVANLIMAMSHVAINLETGWILPVAQASDTVLPLSTMTDDGAHGEWLYRQPRKDLRNRARNFTNAIHDAWVASITVLATAPEAEEIVCRQRQVG